MQIVLARCEEGFEILEYGRVDLGERHKLKSIKVPKSLMWLNEGTNEDKKKADIYAKREGYTVFCYYDEDDPLARARKEVLKLAKRW